MRNFVFAAVAALAILGQTTAEARSLRLPAKQLAINAFVHLQTAGDHLELVKQTKQLEAEGLELELSNTDAVLLRGQCGFAGCDSIYLVTTPLTSRGANTRTEVISAVVSANDYRQSHHVVKVLSRSDLENIERE